MGWWLGFRPCRLTRSSSPTLGSSARAVQMQMDGDSPAGPLQLLAAIFFLTLSLGPIAMSAAIRISVEN